MLTRATKRLPTLHYQQTRLFAVGSSYDAWKDRVSSLRSTYPNLFNAQSFISDQEQLLSSYKSSVSSLLNEYESSRQQIKTESTSENVFMELSESDLLNDLNSRNKPFYTSLSEQEDDISAKLRLGEEYVDKIIQLQSEQDSASNIEQQNLKMIEIADYGDKIDEWLIRFPDPLNDSADLGLPIGDEEVDQWVREQYHHAPDEVREQGAASYDEHKEIEEKWMKTLDDKLVEVLRERDSNFDENKFREFCDVTNEMFHPHSIDHYEMSNYAKSLFRAALWQSKDRCNAVEQSMEIVSELLDDTRDDDSTVMRGLYEESPNTRFANFAAFQLKITDPLFSAKLIEEIRIKLEETALDRAQKDVLYNLQVPYLQKEKNDLKTELEESLSTNPASMKRGIEVLQREEDSYNIEVPSLESILDELLPKKLWNNDISQVKQTIISYSKGSASLSDIDKAIESTLNPSSSSDINDVSDSEILDISVKYHNSRYSSVENYNFTDFLTQTTIKKDAQSILENRRIVNKKLNKLGVDPLVINLIRILIEDGTATQLNKICNDYLDIMKRFRGEIEGFVTSATELDENIFDQIRTAIESANPGKKITLERLVDPGLQSGFIVKAGVQRFDFSLATVIHSGRTQVGTL